MYGYIYETTNLINNKKYIGKHKADKFDENYYGSGVALKRALIKYGKENFEIKILEEVNTNQKDLNELEIYYIKKYNAVKDKNYYNNSYGGESEGWYGYNQVIKEIGVSDEFRIKRSQSQKGHPSMFKGHHHSEESKEKIRQALKGKKRVISNDIRYNLGSGMRGKRHSAETKEKMSAALKGRQFSPLHKQKLSQAGLGRNNSMYGKPAWNHGKIWINNGINNTCVLPNELEFYLAKGYFKGRLKLTKRY